MERGAGTVSTDKRQVKVEALRKWHGDTRTCLATVDGECGVCAIFDCPYNCPFHYHHDGCPECNRDPYCELVSNPDKIMPPATYGDDTK